MFQFFLLSTIHNFCGSDTPSVHVEPNGYSKKHITAIENPVDLKNHDHWEDEDKAMRYKKKELSGNFAECFPSFQWLEIWIE